MNIPSRLIATDNEFSQITTVAAEQYRSAKTLPLIINGLSGGALDAFVAAFAEFCRVRLQAAPLLLLLPDALACRKMRDALRALGLDAEVYLRREFLLHNISASHEAERERLYVLDRIASQTPPDLIVTTPDAALQLTITPEALSAARLEIGLDTVISPDELCSILTDAGYAHVEAVDNIGQFSRRGGIVDLFCAESTPCRIEFFGDEIDRICRFDPISQRSVGALSREERLTVLPAREVLTAVPGDPEDDSVSRRISALISTQLKRAKSAEARTALSSELEAIGAGAGFFCYDKYIAIVYDRPCCLLDHLSAGGRRFIALLCGKNELAESLAASNKIEAGKIEALITDERIYPRAAFYSLPAEELERRLETNLVLHLNSFSGGLGSLRASGLFGFRARRTVSYAGKPDLLCEDLANYLKLRYLVYLAVSGDTEAETLSSLLRDRGFVAIRAGENPPDPKSADRSAIYIVKGELSGGFELLTEKLAILITSESGSSSGGTKKGSLRRGRRANKSAGERIMSFADLSPGDLVVHDVHGIGRFDGIRNLTIDGVSKDYVTILYAGTDKLFLPAERLDAIAKYIGSRDDASVKLSKLGGGDWQKLKSRAKASAKKMAGELIALYAERQRRPGITFPADDELQREFEDRFDYDETDSQLQAVAEIKADMEKSVPMDRLLCGDVGFGKTEVALRAAFKAVAAGYQVAILVPTTILAMQHYQTVSSRMRGFPVSIEMLSRFVSASGQAATCRRIARGETDIVIGTHKLLSEKIKFARLGLLIVDEEQRFGVAQKEKLKALGANVDVLTLTATPIPRTLNMAMNGIRDISILDEAPGDRFPVQTYVLEHDEAVINEAIGRELLRGGQVIYLYNKVESIDTVAARISRNFPDARIAIGHGKMEREDLEEVWQSLVDERTDIIVCTTIVETGIDLPNANTLIIENSDRLGLAQLHQIRGRVGRSNRQAYAYFTYRRGRALTEIAEGRLEAIREYTEFGAGFKIALRDLELRGAGNLLGSEQHGNVDAVGYDMYIRLIDEAVNEQRLAQSGEAPPPPPAAETLIDIKADAHIPPEYVADSSRRIEMYKKISLIGSRDDLSDVLDELCDRFGEPPLVTQRLLWAALCRAIGRRRGFKSIEQREGTLRFISDSPDLAVWSEVFEAEGGLRFATVGGVCAVTRKLARGDDPYDVACDIMETYDRMASSGNAD